VGKISNAYSFICRYLFQGNFVSEVLVNVIEYAPEAAFLRGYPGLLGNAEDPYNALFAVKVQQAVYRGETGKLIMRRLSEVTARHIKKKRHRCMIRSRSCGKHIAKHDAFHAQLVNGRIEGLERLPTQLDSQYQQILLWIRLKAMLVHWVQIEEVARANLELAAPGNHHAFPFQHQPYLNIAVHVRVARAQPDYEYFEDAYLYMVNYFVVHSIALRNAFWCRRTHCTTIVSYYQIFVNRAFAFFAFFLKNFCVFF
jgi:hypothetical protein